MSTLTYKGTAYRQSRDPRAPWLINLVVPAEELLAWAGIPRRVEGRDIGFQRTEDEDRVLKAKAFFEKDRNNQSPTALVVGIHPIAGGEKRRVALAFNDKDEKAMARPCTLTIDLSEDESLASVVARLKAQLTMRIEKSEPGVADELEDVVAVPTEDEVASVEGNGEGDLADDEVEASSDGEIEIGRSMLGKFLEMLENPLWCETHETDLRELAKPATIIDGQHRVLGAARCERLIPFTVCALFDCPWSEQVFQFTVVNYTAKGIPDQFITANASMSLTAVELRGLESRLAQAGVKVIEYQLMRVVNFEADSPFYERINLTEKVDANKIGYKTMVRVARRWYDGKQNGVRKIIDHLYPEIKGRAARRRRIDRWKEGAWGDFFLEFWNAVQEKYQSVKRVDEKTLWDPGSQLLVAVVLYELQEAFLVNLTNQAESFFETESPDTAHGELLLAVSGRTKELLKYIPAEFFTTPWKVKSLNTSAGREVLHQAIRNLIDSGGKSNFKASQLITGNF